jgi:hypothetical protein
MQQNKERNKRIWHINHSNKDATNKVVEITIKNLEKIGFESYYIHPTSILLKKKIIGFIFISAILLKIYLLKAFRLIITKKEYYFYNIIDNFSVFPHNWIYKQIGKPDFVFIYWVSGYLTSKDIERLFYKFECKIFWYPTDMAPFTGGCHYSWSCTNYKSNCRDCPAIKFRILNNIYYYNLL